MENEKDEPEKTKKEALSVDKNMHGSGSDTPNVNVKKVDKVFSEKAQPSLVIQQ